VDTSGDTYIAGQTTSINFPTDNGFASSGNSNGVAFVTELNPTGTAILYSTYLGGTGGDWGAGLAIDPSGNVYVTGSTLSTDFPVVNGIQSSLLSPNGNAFVRISPTQSGAASLVYSTYLGGGSNTSNSLGDVGLAIAADASGLAYVTGQTASDMSLAPFPTTPNALQSTLTSVNGNAFLTVLDTTSGGPDSLIYSTYLGGGSTGFGDYGLGIAVDGSGDVPYRTDNLRRLQPVPHNLRWDLPSGTFLCFSFEVLPIHPGEFGRGRNRGEFGAHSGQTPSWLGRAMATWSLETAVPPSSRMAQRLSRLMGFPFPAQSSPRLNLIPFSIQFA
jgi:hypothetical protein